MSLSRWFRRFFNLDRRYGVRFNGDTERTGFMSDLHAAHWAEERGHRQYVVFFYSPIDMRIPGRTNPGRDRMVQ